MPPPQILHSSKIGAHLCTEQKHWPWAVCILLFQNWCPPLSAQNKHWQWSLCSLRFQNWCPSLHKTNNGNAPRLNWCPPLHRTNTGNAPHFNFCTVLKLVPTSAQNRHWQLAPSAFCSSKIGALLWTKQTLAIGIPYILRFKNWYPPLQKTNTGHKHLLHFAVPQLVPTSAQNKHWP